MIQFLVAVRIANHTKIRIVRFVLFIPVILQMIKSISFPVILQMIKSISFCQVLHPDFPQLPSFLAGISLKQHYYQIKYNSTSTSLPFGFFVRRTLFKLLEEHFSLSPKSHFFVSLFQKLYLPLIATDVNRSASWSLQV